MLWEMIPSLITALPLFTLSPSPSCTCNAGYLLVDGSIMSEEFFKAAYYGNLTAEQQGIRLKKGIYCMVYLHSFLLHFFPKRAARKKQFLMSVLTEQRLTKFQQLPVICNAISSTMTFVNYRNLTNEILVRGSPTPVISFPRVVQKFLSVG